MDIKNKELEIFMNNFYNNNLTIDNIDRFGNEISVDGLKEFFDLIANEQAELFALKVYTTVYDKEKIKKLEQLKSPKYIDAIFAGMWFNEASDELSEGLSQAMLGFVLFGSDLVTRIRNGYEILGYPKDEFNKQIYSFVLFLNESIKNKTFFKDISQVKTNASDDALFKSNAEEFDSIKKIKERIELASMILQDEPNIQSIFETRFESVSKENLNFLDKKELQKLDKKAGNLLVEAPIESRSNIEDTPFISEDLSTFEVLEDQDDGIGFVEWIKSRINKDKVENKTSIKLNSLRTKNASRKGSSLKVTVVLFLCIATAGLGIVAATQQSKVDENKTIDEKIVEENIEKKKFSIKRSGTNKDS